MAKTVLFDASALVALLLREKGAQTVRNILDSDIQTCVTSVNLTEAVFVARQKQAQLAVHSPASVVDILTGLGLVVVDVTVDDVAEAVHMLDIGRDASRLDRQRKDLSLGDAVCLAVGRRLGAVVVGDDAGWDDLAAGVDVQQFR